MLSKIKQMDQFKYSNNIIFVVYICRLFLRPSIALDFRNFKIIYIISGVRCPHYIVANMLDYVVSE